MFSIRRRAAVAAITVATALATLPGSAQADNLRTCTILGGVRTDYVCVHASGNSLYVSRVDALFIAPFATPCNTRLYITFFDVNNVKYDQRISALNGTCRISGEYYQTYNKTMRAGRVCAALSINGSLKPGACKSIFR